MQIDACFALGMSHQPTATAGQGAAACCELNLPYFLSNIYHILQPFSLFERGDFFPINSPSNFIIRILFLQYIFQRLNVRVLHYARS